MSIKAIFQAGNTEQLARLRQNSEPFVLDDDGSSEPAKDRIAELVNSFCSVIRPYEHRRCIGLSAAQIGAPERVFILFTPRDSVLRAFINPEIEVSASDIISWDWGRSLSADGIRVRIPRPNVVRLSSRTMYAIRGDQWERSAKFKTVYAGNSAHIVQQQMDHLDGKLALDHVSVDELDAFIRRKGQISGDPSADLLFSTRDALWMQGRNTEAHNAPAKLTAPELEALQVYRASRINTPDAAPVSERPTYEPY